MPRRPGRLQRLLRRVLLVLLAGVAGALVWLWLGGGPGSGQAFERIYQVSVEQASANFTLEAALGMPLKASRDKARYHFSREGGHGHVRFRFPLQGPRGTVTVEGEAVRIGRNWLIVQLVARFPGHGGVVDLSPNVAT